ncbi:MAG: hypothetical protein D4S01_10270 [Dehalococcoidia bacterium]|nr:MAG: hypothetical protein D4S01_10270 [Dehalococcoidia bacterium]
MVYKIGQLSSDKDAMKRELVRNTLYTEAETYLEFGAAVEMRTLDNLQFGLTLPKIERLDPEEIEEGALAQYQKIGWFDVETRLKKYQTRLMTTDEAKVRNQIGLQMDYTMTTVARGLAWAKDEEIKNALTTAAGTDIGADAHWDDPASSNIPSDIAQAVKYVLTNTYMTVEMMRGALLFYPAELWAFMNQPARPNEFTTYGMSPIEWIQQKYGIEFRPTRQLDGGAMLVYPGQETALHLVYEGDGIPLVEEAREYGVGDMWYVTQLYRTYVMPNSQTDTTKNNRIITISDVCDTR